MPGFNQKGPLGQGPMTGRRLGRCTNYGADLNKDLKPVSDNQNRDATDYPAGRGMGWRKGGAGRSMRGMGLRNRLRGSF